MTTDGTHSGGQTLGGMTFVAGSDATELAQRLAVDIHARLGAAIQQRGAASLVVSGGSTPKPFFEHLASLPLDWSKVSVLLADERWVPDTHADSNAALVRKTLLVGDAARAKYVDLYVDQPTPEQGLETIEARLASVTRPFDVVILGMGGDSHTASLFPDAPELEHAMSVSDMSVAAMHPPSVPQARITLTRAALLDSAIRCLHITGDEKRDVLTQALEASPPQAPIARVLQASPDGVTIYWAP